jgi:glycosyltransferase involved in cell wall biosynthesis
LFPVIEQKKMIHKKILHIVEDLNIGGLEKVVESIVTEIDKNKYEVQVWCLTKGGEIADELISKGIRVKILGLNSYHNPFQVVKLAIHLKKSKFDIIHSHGYFANVFGRLAAILTMIPVRIAHVHTTNYNLSKRNITTEFVFSLFTKKIICISNSVKQFVEKDLGIDTKKTCLIYNGCRINDSDKAKKKIDRRSLGISKDDFVIITVASLVRHKGHQVLIDAVCILARSYQNLRLLIVGDGPLRDSLNTYVKALQLSEKIIFTGEKENVFPLLKLADIFVLSSITREGLGMALIEAMAVGLPLIGSRLGGIPEIIKHGVNGFLFSQGNAEELAESIEKLIKNKEMAVNLGERGKEIFREKFTCQKMTKNIEQLYDSFYGGDKPGEFKTG